MDQHTPLPNYSDSVTDTPDIYPQFIHQTQLPLIQSTRTTHPPSYLSNYHCYSTSSKSSFSKVFYHLSSVLSYSQCSHAY